MTRSRTSTPVSAEGIARLAERGKDVSRYFTNSGGMMAPGGKRAGASGVDKYIAKAPEEVRGRLKAIRAAIRAAAPGATERTDYFRLPGYSYDDQGYDYDGMFVWFSYKGREARLHLRPPVIQNHTQELAGCATTKAIVAFPAEKALSAALVKKLVRASVKVMKDRAK